MATAIIVIHCTKKQGFAAVDISDCCVSLSSVNCWHYRENIVDRNSRYFHLIYSLHYIIIYHNMLSLHEHYSYFYINDLYLHNTFLVQMTTLSTWHYRLCPPPSSFIFQQWSENRNTMFFVSHFQLNFAMGPR